MFSYLSISLLLTSIFATFPIFSMNMNTIVRHKLFPELLKGYSKQALSNTTNGYLNVKQFHSKNNSNYTFFNKKSKMKYAAIMSALGGGTATALWLWKNMNEAEAEYGFQMFLQEKVYGGYHMNIAVKLPSKPMEIPSEEKINLSLKKIFGVEDNTKLPKITLSGECRLHQAKKDEAIELCKQHNIPLNESQTAVILDKLTPNQAALACKKHILNYEDASYKLIYQHAIRSDDTTFFSEFGRNELLDGIYDKMPINETIRGILGMVLWGDSYSYEILRNSKTNLIEIKSIIAQAAKDNKAEVEKALVCIEKAAIKGDHLAQKTLLTHISPFSVLPIERTLPWLFKADVKRLPEIPLILNNIKELIKCNKIELTQEVVEGIKRICPSDLYDSNLFDKTMYDLGRYFESKKEYTKAFSLWLKMDIPHFSTMSTMGKYSLENKNYENAINFLLVALSSKDPWFYDSIKNDIKQKLYDLLKQGKFNATQISIAKGLIPNDEEFNTLLKNLKH